jgi:hypothetical protein
MPDLLSYPDGEGYKAYAMTLFQPMMRTPPPLRGYTWYFESGYLYYTGGAKKKKSNTGIEDLDGSADLLP